MFGAMTIRSISSVLTAFLITACGQPEFDLVLEGGMVVDGTGAPAFTADVAVLDQVIVEVGDLSGRSATDRIDVTGHYVAPGFIDIHTHSIGLIREERDADNFVRQGVTTLMEGNDGNSPLDLGGFYDSLSAGGPVAPNFGMFVGHGSIRSEVIGNEDRAATPDELDRMRAYVATGMEEGAFGLSTGLFYLPGSFAETSEVIELAKVAAAAGGMYISHMRNEDVNVLQSVKETIRIGREAGIPVQMTHHKVGGHRNFGRSVESLELIAAARAEGVDITFDQYPYTASSTGLSSVIPRWAQAGGQLADRLSDPATRRRVVDDIEAFVEMRFADDPSKIQLVSCSFDEESAAAFPDDLSGWTLADIFTARDVPGTPAQIADLILEIDAAGRCGAIFHAFDEEDGERFMQSEFGMIGSDGRLSRFGEASPHPRGYGTFARVLGVYARERGVITMEEGVRRMTSAPADRLGLSDRGRVFPGMVADLTVFDPETVADRATFDDPHQYAVGIPHVFVGGIAVVRDSEVTGMRPGVVLRGPGYPHR